MRQLELELRCERRYDVPLRVTLDMIRLLTEKNARLHRLSQRVYRRVRDLRSIDEYPVPVYGELLRAAHRREQHPTAARLLIYLTNDLIAPSGVLADGIGIFNYLQRMSRAIAYTALAVDAAALIAYHHAALFVIAMNAAGALLFAYTADGTAARVAYYLKFWCYVNGIHQNVPSFSLMITASPPAGMRMFSASGSIRLMAASSLAM